MPISVITNGLLLTPEVVDRLLPYGLRGVKITLDGDRDTHNRMRPLRGGQGTFDRLIENIRSVAGRTSIAIGGNFDESSADSFSGLIDFLSQQDFADKLVNVNFKPIVRNEKTPRVSAASPVVKGMLPMIQVGANGKPLGGTCMSNVGDGGGAGCDSCDFLDDKMALLREQTKSKGFYTPDGVHGGPCHVHHTHAHTIGPDGSLYACPGFTGEKVDVHRPHRRPAGRKAGERARRVRAAPPLGRVSGLRIYAHVCGGMPGRIAHATWRHEQADMSQAEFRVGPRFAGT